MTHVRHQAMYPTPGEIRGEGPDRVYMAWAHARSCTAGDTRPGFLGRIRTSSPGTFTLQAGSMARSKAVREWVTGRGGLVHGHDARDAGFSRRDIDEAVRADLLRRVRRVWLAAPSVDRGRLVAVSIGGRLTCVSAAKRAGLWVPDITRIHVSVAPNASRFERAGAIIHWSTGPAPTQPRTAEQPVLNSLFHVAQCLPRLDALAVWESALNRGLVSGGALTRVPWGSARARELAHAASVLSDSGLETFMATRLAPFGISVRQQVWIDGHPLDVLVGDRLAIQLDGSAHLKQRQRRKDIRGDARLVLLGYTVLRFDYQQVLFDWEYVESTILTAIAQGRHRAG